MVSIIIPIYNTEKYLRECLDSLVGQTYRDLEVLMVNDGSTDSSKTICEEYEKKYPNFKLINKENGGQMSAWILGVQYAKGEYFGFVDSDDKVSPEMYEKMMTCQEETGADLVMCNFFDYDKEKVTPRNSRCKSFYSEASIQELYDIVFPTMTSFISMSRWDKLFKRDIFIENMRKYCNRIAQSFEDRFIVIPYLFSCKSFAYIEEPLYYWRHRKLSSSKKPDFNGMTAIEDLFRGNKQALKDKGLFDRYRDKLEIGKIDAIRCIIEKNIVGPWTQKEKYKFAKQILTNENRGYVLKHKKELTGKFGKYLTLACMLNSKRFLVIAKEIMNKIRKGPSNENAFD